MKNRPWHVTHGMISFSAIIGVTSEQICWHFACFGIDKHDKTSNICLTKCRMDVLTEVCHPKHQKSTSKVFSRNPTQFQSSYKNDLPANKIEIANLGLIDIKLGKKRNIYNIFSEVQTERSYINST